MTFLEGVQHGFDGKEHAAIDNLDLTIDSVMFVSGFWKHSDIRSAASRKAELL